MLDFACAGSCSTTRRRSTWCSPTSATSSYDLARDREAPRLSIAIDDLPKYSEAFPFSTTTRKPGDAPRIVIAAAAMVAA